MTKSGNRVPNKKMITHDLIFIFLVYLQAKSLTKPSRFEFSRIYFSIDKITNSFN